MSAIGIALCGDVHCADVVKSFGSLAGALNVLGQQNKPGACAEDRQTFLYVIAHKRHELQVVEQLALRSALASGYDEPVFSHVPVSFLAHFEEVYAQPAQHLLMF